MGVSFRGVSEFFTTSSTDAHTVPMARARGKHLLPFLCRSTKKGRKKGNQRLPPLETSPVPLFKEKKEKDIFDPMHLSPRSHHERQAKEAKSFLFEI